MDRDPRADAGGAAAPDYARHAQTKFATLRGDDEEEDERGAGPWPPPRCAPCTRRPRRSRASP